MSNGLYCLVLYRYGRAETHYYKTMSARNKWAADYRRYGWKVVIPARV